MLYQKRHATPKPTTTESRAYQKLFRRKKSLGDEKYQTYSDFNDFARETNTSFKKSSKAEMHKEAIKKDIQMNIDKYNKKDSRFDSI